MYHLSLSSVISAHSFIVFGFICRLNELFCSKIHQNIWYFRHCVI